MAASTVKVYITDQVPVFSLAAFEDLQTTLAARTWSHRSPRVFDYDIEKEVDGILVHEDGLGVELVLRGRPWSDSENAEHVSDIEAMLEALRHFSVRSRLYLEIEFEDEVVGTIESGVRVEDLTRLLR